MARKIKKEQWKKKEAVIDAENSVVETGASGAPVKDIHWNASEINTASDTHLEDDEGYGGAAIIRKFEFGMNPTAFNEHPPTKQELFNAHLKGIEIMLWRDGLKIMTEVNPKLILDEKRKTYSIFVGAQPMRGHILHERPRTLSEIALQK